MYHFQLTNVAKKLHEISKYMSQIDDKETAHFWNQFRIVRDEKPLQESDFVSFYAAEKATGIDRRTVKNLGQENIIRTNQNGNVALPDLKVIQSVLSIFESAKQAKVIQETTIMGQNKYLILDYNKNKKGKLVSLYQIELLKKIHSDFFGQFYNLVPKQNVDIPDEIKS